MSFILSRARPDIISMKAYVSARSLHAQTKGMVYLDANECPYEPFIGAENISRYPDQQPQELIDVICRLYDVSSRNLLIGRGADEMIDLLVRSFCISGKDNILICPPTFAMYENAAVLQKATIKKVPLTKDFELEVKSIKSTADDNTKVIFICSPNNPTGNEINNDVVKELCDYFDGKALIVVDETYKEFSKQESLLPDIEKIENIVVLRTLSKSYAAAGLRCGFAFGQSEVIALLRKVLAVYPIPQPVVSTALKILTPKNIKRLSQKRQEVLAIKEKFTTELKTIKSVQKVYPSDTNYLLIQFDNAQEACQKLLNHKIIVRDQSYQEGLNDCVRISIGTKEEMDKVVSVLRDEVMNISKNDRVASITRKTKETAIAVNINLDQSSPVKINTGVPFYDHMLEQIAKHGGFSMVLECEGDLDIEAHHTVEDCAIALGEALRKALDDKRGIGRYGSESLILPMDETQAQVALDLGGRFYLKFEGDFPDQYVGNTDNPLPIDMVEHVFRSLAEKLEATLHISVQGENTHHMVEACFKGVGRALRKAIRIEGQDLPSTKGTL